MPTQPTTPATWATGLFDCCAVKDAGPLCCFNHCCCGLCLWQDALVKANVPNANKYGLAMVFGSLLGGSNNAVLRGFGGATSTVSGIGGRQAIAKQYGIEESTFQSYASKCCCAPCAQVQEVNTVMVRERLAYDCASLKPDGTPPAPAAKPQPFAMRR